MRCSWQGFPLIGEVQEVTELREVELVSFQIPDSRNQKLWGRLSMARVSA